MNTRKLSHIAVIGICSILYFNEAEAQTKQVNMNIDFGAVNGTVINSSTVRINKILKSPLLLSVDKASMKKPIQYLRIKDAKLVKVNDNNIVILVRKILSDGSDALITMTLSMSVNSVKLANITTSQENSDIEITVPPKFKQLALKVEGAVVMDIPRLYKGPLDFSIDIEAWNNKHP